MAFKYGRKPPTNAPALKLGPLLTGVAPDHPSAVDYLGRLQDWQMLGNDAYGDCVAVTWANLRRLITHQMGSEDYPNLGEVELLYETQNPNFPSEDNGMVIQTCLDYLVKHGGPDNVKAVAFAKVDFTNEAELDAALAIFGGVWVGFNVTAANERQFDAGQPWDYIAGSQDVGGHSVLAGGYRGVTTGGDVQFVTWAQQTAFTDTCRTRQWEEAWVVIWPEHWTMTPFLEGIDQGKLAQAYQELTGKTIVPPVGPDPVPPPPPDPVPPTPTPPPIPPDPGPGCWNTVIEKLESIQDAVRDALRYARRHRP